MVKRLIVTRNAYLHIDRIIEFNNLRNQSTTYSKKFVRALFKELNSLKKFPFRGVKTSKEHVLLLIWNDYYIYSQLPTQQSKYNPFTIKRKI